MRTLLASTIAVAACWAAAFAAVSSGSPLTSGVVRIVAADALVIEAAALAVLAPLAGVMLMAHTPGASRAAQLRRLALPGVVFTAVSCIAALAAASMTGMTMALAIRSHATLCAVALALTALGALCRTLCRDVLDAAAAAIVVSIAISAAVLVGGPALAEWPQALVDMGLLASPPIAVSASAGLDLLRGEVLYQLSPISHRRFTYPAWHTSVLTYAAAAAVFTAAGFRKSHIKQEKSE